MALIYRVVYVSLVPVVCLFFFFDFCFHLFLIFQFSIFILCLPVCLAERCTSVHAYCIDALTYMDTSRQKTGGFVSKIACVLSIVCIVLLLRVEETFMFGRLKEKPFCFIFIVCIYILIITFTLVADIETLSAVINIDRIRSDAFIYITKSYHLISQQIYNIAMLIRKGACNTNNTLGIHLYLLNMSLSIK